MKNKFKETDYPTTGEAECNECGWIGPFTATIDDPADTNPTCPHCGSDSIIKIP